jgi:hypothetical protein
MSSTFLSIERILLILTVSKIMIVIRLLSLNSNKSEVSSYKFKRGIMLHIPVGP